MSDAKPDGAGWYADVAAALAGKPPDEVARELPGLVDHLTDSGPNTDHYLVGVSFSKRHTGLDYAVDRILSPGDEPIVEPVVEPASERHEYVHFAHPPDPHFDAGALRARLLGAIDRERRQAATPEDKTDRLADLWQKL